MYAVHYVDDAWYRIFPDAEDGELDGRDALVEATVTVGVGEGIPCGEDVGGRKRGVAGRTSPPTTWGGINRKMLPYCESTEALYGEKRQIVYSGFCTNMILSKISPAETATRT